MSMQENKEQPSEKESLIAEKSLSDIFWLVVNSKEKKNNIAPVFAFFIVVSLLVFFNWWEISSIVAFLRSMLNNGFSLGLNLLGFLLAGFTVFTSVYKTDLLLMMADIEKEEAGVSVLKYNIFRFMWFFIVLLSFIFAFFFLIILCQPKGVLSILSEWAEIGYKARCNWIKFVFVSALSMQFYLLICLKTLIFDIYHIIMTSISYESIMASEEPQEHDSQETQGEKKTLGFKND